jgi:hypothetical protein
VVPGTIIPPVPAIFLKYSTQWGHYNVVKYNDPNIPSSLPPLKGLTSGPSHNRAKPRPQRELQKPLPVFWTLNFAGALTPLLRGRSSHYVLAPGMVMS